MFIWELLTEVPECLKLTKILNKSQKDDSEKWVKYYVK